MKGLICVLIPDTFGVWRGLYKIHSLGFGVCPEITNKDRFELLMDALWIVG